jgi:hypothetical protein
MRIGTAAREVQVPGGIVRYESPGCRASQLIRELKISSKRPNDRNVMCIRDAAITPHLPPWRAEGKCGGSRVFSFDSPVI